MCCFTEGLPLRAQHTRSRSGSASIRSSCTAERAEQLGLVNLVVPPDRLLDAARALAQRITRHAPTAVAACLAAVTSGINVPIKAMAAANETRRSWIKALLQRRTAPKAALQFTAETMAADTRTLSRWLSGQPHRAQDTAADLGIAAPGQE